MKVFLDQGLRRCGDTAELRPHAVCAFLGPWTVSCVLRSPRSTLSLMWGFWVHNVLSWTLVVFHVRLGKLGLIIELENIPAVEIFV